MTKIMWHRLTGESKIFIADETPGADYLGYHPSDVSKQPPTPPAPTPEPVPPAPTPEPAPSAPTPEPVPEVMTKREIMDALKSGDITFDPKAKVNDLEQLLVAKVKLVLASAEPPVVFTEDESARSLYGKLQAYFAARTSEQTQE